MDYFLITLRTLFPVRIHKKNYWQSQFYSDMPVQQYRPEYPFQDRQEATSMLGNYGRKRRRRGVYNECCEKSCSKDQLLMYCAAPSSTTPTPTSTSRSRWKHNKNNSGSNLFSTKVFRLYEVKILEGKTDKFVRRQRQVILYVCMAVKLDYRIRLTCFA